ncbi:MAG: hypothetical protein RLY16_2224 [Bacteroidota bacterium]|jgi:protein-tyrosine phosphatase
MKILFLCLGNICRSPLAEGILQHKVKKLGLNWKIDSAGTNGFHDGEHPHRLSQKVARLHGIDISKQISRRFTTSDFDKFDHIYALAGDVVQELKYLTGANFQPAKVSLLLDALHPGSNKDVPDPWYGGEDGYHEVYALIEAACNAIIQQYNNHTSTEKEKPI